MITEVHTLGVRASPCRMEKMETKQTLHQEKKRLKKAAERCLEKATSEGREVTGKIVAEESPGRESDVRDAVM